MLLGSAALLLPLAEPVGQRTGFVARTLLAVAATAMATPVQAQTVETLVSNTGPTSSSSVALSHKGTQRFTTGAHTAGYTLSSVDIVVRLSNAFSLSVCETGGDGFPTSTCTNLTPPATFAGGAVTFTAPADTTLSASTTYAVVVTKGSQNLEARQISSDSEDTGAATGWSIRNNYDSLDSAAGSWNADGSNSLQIAIKGYANTPPNNAPTVANPITDQTAMEGQAFSFTFPDTTFADEDTDDTLTYTATLSDDSALPTWLSFDDTTRSFSGTPQASDGGTITVRVTASDDTDDVHDDFEIKVATVCAEPTFGTRRQIWTSTLTVGERAIGTTVFNYGYIFAGGMGDGALSDEDFDIGANRYELDEVSVSALSSTLGDLRFKLGGSSQSGNFLTAAQVVALQLHVCDTAYDFSDASYDSNTQTYTWEANLDWSAESERTVYLSLPENNAATGLPTISSDAADGATVGDTLTANQGDIADSDGLPATFPDDYTFLWLREDEDGSNQQAIPGQTSETYTLTNDDVDKKVRVRVSFTDQLSGMETVTSAAFPASGTVIPIPPMVTISGPSAAVEEGNDLAFTLTLDEAAPTDLTVDVTVVETEDMVAGTDEGSRMVTVAQGQTQATFTVATQNDDVDEADSVVTVTVMADGDDPATYELGSPSEATVTVSDDDEREVMVSGSPLMMNEGGTGVYTVVLTSRPTGEVTITPSSDNSDVTFMPSTLTFTADDWSTAQEVTVTAAQDADSTDDSATISHVVAGADYGDNSVTAASVAVTVSEVVVTIAADTSPVSEGTDAVFTLTRTGITTAALTVDVTVTETGDMVAGTNEGSRMVTVMEGQTQATFTVATQNDDVDEADSVVTATVMADGDTPAAYNVGSPSQATVTVSDDDEREVVVSGSPVTVNEGGTGAYRVVLRSQPTGEVTITPSSDNEDVSVSPQTLTFTAVNWETTQMVTVTTVDDDDEMDDTATITHTVTGADYQGITVDSVMVTVSEIALPIVSIAADASPVSEGTAAVFTLTRTGDDTTHALTVNVAVTENREVLSGSAPTSVIFDAGSTTATLSVATDDDALDEDDDTVMATVAADSAAPRTYVLGTLASASVVVNDNDPTPLVMLLLSPDTIAEAAGVSEIQATLSNPSAVETRVTVSLPAEVAGAVELDADPPVLVIPAGMTDGSNTVTLTAVDNDAEAPDLSVTVSGMGSNTVGVTNPEPVTLTITDDDGTAPMDTTAPRLASIERQIPGASPTNADSLTWRITFSETVVNVDTADFTVSGSTATVTNVEPVGGEPLAYDVTVSSGDLANFNGTVTLGFASDQNIADGANRVLNNTMPTETNDNSYQVDHAAPRVEINVPATSTAPFTATITFNEMVSGFTVDDITVSSNATLSDFTEATTEEAAPGMAWTVLVTPEMDGAVTLDIAADVAMDAAGNGNTAAPPASSTYSAAPVNEGPSSTTPVREEPSIPPPLRDTTAPLVASILRQAPTTSPTNADSLTWRVTFSETVLNVDRLDFTVSGSTATVTNVEPVSDAPLVYDVTVSGGDLANFNGTVMLSVASGRNIQDENGNALANTMPTGANDNSYMVDNAAPTVGIGGVPATSAAPFTATITFNEMVSGFMVDDIMVVNATLSDFTAATTEEATTGEVTPGMVWTVLVTPAADGLVMLDIAADVATDAAGNGNTAATQARSTYTAPAMEIEATEEARKVLSQVILPEVMQQLTAETTEVITSRLNSIASGAPGAPSTLSLDEVVADTVAAFHGEREHLKNGSLDWRQALSGRDFVWPLSSLNVAQGEGAGAQDDHPFSTLALWGGGNYSSYRNIIEHTDVDGDSFSAVIGMDLQPIPRLTTGLALITSRWGLDYTTNTNTNDATGASAEGVYKIGVTMVNPYVNWSATEQLSLWATFGHGRGEVEQDPEDGNGTTRTDGLTSWAGGVRFEVVPAMDPRTGQGSPFGLAFKANGATSSFLDTQVQLARLAAEVSRSFAVESGLLSAALELGWSIRSVSDQDDRDGQQQAIAEKNDGGGAELAGRLNWRHADGSLSATVDTRVLLVGGHHREWGIGGYLRLTPSRRDGEGLSLTLQPSLGVTDTRLDELWSLSGDGDLAISNDEPGARLDVQLAYGFPLGNAILTPYTELTWAEAANAYGAGLRYGLTPSSMKLDLKGVRRSNAEGNPEHRRLLQLRSDL